MKTVRIKRVYDAPEEGDGFRVLVDRLWPRGISKEKTGIDLWLKEAAPSDGLRKWFNHEPQKWLEFKERYSRELHGRTEALKPILERHGTTVTLLYSAADVEHNNAVALKEYIESLG
jgi:uncharacterized protein YeaO (DUF488 family)